jgi:hypothetical protein
LIFEPRSPVGAAAERFLGVLKTLLAIRFATITNYVLTSFWRTREMSRSPKTCVAVISAVLVLVLAGCGGGSNANLRVVNTSPDAGQLDVVVDSKTVYTGLSYINSTDYLSVSSGSRRVQIEHTGSSTAVVDQTLSLNSEANYTLLAANFSSSITGLVFTDDNTAPSSGDIKLRFINASPSLGPVDIYIVAPGTDLSSVSANISGLAFQSASSYQTLDAGSYDIFFTAPGTKFAFISTGTLSLTSGQIRTLVALNAQGGGFTSTTLTDK